MPNLTISHYSGVRVHDFLKDDSLEKAERDVWKSRIFIVTGVALVALSLIAGVIGTITMIERIKSFNLYGRMHVLTVLDPQMPREAWRAMVVKIILCPLGIIATAGSSFLLGLLTYHGIKAANWRSKLKDLTALQQNDPFCVLSPQQVADLGMDENTFHLWEDCKDHYNLAQDYLRFKNKTIPTYAQYKERFGRNNLTFWGWMRLLKEIEEKPHDQVEPFLLSEEMLRLMRDYPDTHEAFKFVLLSRKDHDFSLLLFKMACKIIQPEADLSQIGKQSIRLNLIQKDSKEHVEGDLQTLRFLAPNLFALNDFGNVYLTESSVCSVKELKEVFDAILNHQDPSLHWLLERYAILDTYQIKPFLYRMHRLLLDHGAELNRHTSFSFKEIAELFTARVPAEVGDIKERWEKAKVDPVNLPLVRVYQRGFQLKALAQKSAEYVRSLTKMSEIRSIEEQAQAVEDTTLLQICKECRENLEREANVERKSFFEMSKEEFQQFVVNFKLNWESSSSDYLGLLEKGYTKQEAASFCQIDKTLKTFKDATPDQIEVLFQQRAFQTFLPFSLFESIRTTLLLGRKDFDFRVKIHHLYLNAYYPDLQINPESTDRASITLKKGNDSVTLENLPQTILNETGLSKVLDLDGKSYSIQDVRKVITDFVQTKAYSIKELVDCYEISNDFELKLHLFELYEDLGEYFCHFDDEEANRDISPKEIGQLFLAHPPKNLIFTRQVWSQVKWSPYLLIPAINLNRHLKSQELATKIGDFIVSHRWSDKQAETFKEVYELIVQAQDESLKSKFHEAAKKHKNVLIQAWNKMIDLPDDLRKILFAKEG